MFETADSGCVQRDKRGCAEKINGELRREKLNHDFAPPWFFRQHGFSLSRGETKVSAFHLLRFQLRVSLRREFYESPRQRKIAVSFAARAQSAGMVRVERRGLCQTACGKQTDFSEHRLLDVPLVSRHGTRKL